MAYTAVLVGCGGICNAWLGPISETDKLNIIGLVDLNEDAAKAVQEKYDLSDAKVATDLDALLTELSPDIVFDCTVPIAHKSVTLTALKHGCHVLGEKPLSDSMGNARETVEAANASGKTYAVIQNRRYMNQIRAVRKFIESGKLGKVTTVNADFYMGCHFGGFRDEMDHVLLLDMAIHSFDQARLISGANAESVYCQEWNPAESWYAHGASAQCIFEMTDDIIFNYRGSWCAEGLHTSWECDWRIIGTKGTLRWNGDDDIKAAIVQKVDGWQAETEEIQIDIEEVEEFTSHKGVIMNFLKCLEEGSEPETICSDNIHSLAMVFGAVESAEKGSKVSIN
ncbi:MAG: Gfo/Idh/MocA family oxidoreductase [Lentisphaeria bacterium]|nr:Gfo/Idh/MocA family oxidoreductase [Lentisphaeria bacterium]NQZ69334.1 Gfo/Idh/MocA family oxidoreductase [Lentisphaeria bacterium]